MLILVKTVAGASGLDMKPRRVGEPITISTGLKTRRPREGGDDVHELTIIS